ncbi:MAG: OmpA family protein [Chitinophagaceae bacterium]
MRKILFSLCALILTAQFAMGQSKPDCTPLFSGLADHSIQECITREFDKLEIYTKDKSNGYTKSEKTGEYMKVSFSFDGDFQKRPSALQIYQNYTNAITKAGGEVLYNNENSGVYGKLKKGGDTYWIKVHTDGSGFYWQETIKEASMRQDVVMTAQEIGNAMNAEGRVVFYGIYFDTDKAILKPESAPTLTSIAEYLKQHPSIKVFVVGHTDNTGAYAKNQSLSRDRANAVVNELVTKYGVSKGQLIAEGVSSLSPMASNNTEEGRAKNRRVEIVLQ